VGTFPSKPESCRIADWPYPLSPEQREGRYAAARVDKAKENQYLQGQVVPVLV